jgi:putative phosphoribosyl transferase
VSAGPGRFADRTDAGRRLAAHLTHLRSDDPGLPIVVVGLPRGGVPVAAEVADALDAPLDVILVRKLGVPTRPELAMGAIGEDGGRVVNDEIIERAGVADEVLEAVTARERIELDRRARRFRGDRPRSALAGRVVVIVDDGVATGSTARAACRLARAAGAERVVLAVPIAPGDWVDRLGDDADELIAVATADPFVAVGLFYRDFEPTSDEDVVRLLRRS